MFVESSSQLLSDDTVIEKGTAKVVTTSGASLTSASVLISLRTHDERKLTQREQRAVAQEHREQLAAQKAIDQNVAQMNRDERQRKAFDKEELDFQQLRVLREARREHINETNLARRKIDQTVASERVMTECKSLEI